MSTSAVLPISAAAPVDYNSASASTAQQAVFNSVLNQLQQSVASGDLPSSQTLLNAVSAISPSASSGTAPLATFLSNLSTAISSDSISDAQNALITYQTSAASTSSSDSLSLIPTANTAQEAAQITARVVKNASQLFVDTHPKPAPLPSKDASSDNPTVSNLMTMLNAAYPTTNPAIPSSSATPLNSVSATNPIHSASPANFPNTSASPSDSPAAPNPASNASAAETSSPSSSTPYDTLVSSIQASLAGGRGAITPAIAYLQAAGNFVNTSA